MTTYLLYLRDIRNENLQKIGEFKTIKEMLKGVDNYDRKHIIPKFKFFYCENNKGKNYTRKIYTD